VLKARSTAFAQQLRLVVMGPGLRRDDGGALLPRPALLRGAREK
jgi:hypothetical protein